MAEEWKCDSCLYKNNCQKLVTPHKNPIVECTAYKDEADIVSKAAYEQVKWERDVAMEQLKDAGIPFGGKADVAVVVHAKWIEKRNVVGKYFTCSNCGKDENHHTAIKGRYCWYCGAKMDGESDNG